MPQVLFVFSSPSTAEYRVAGLPAAARAVHAIAALRPSDGITGCRITVGGSWDPSEDLLAECSRLARCLVVEFGGGEAESDTLVVNGEAFVAGLARSPAMHRDSVLPELLDAHTRDWAPAHADARQVSEDLARLRRAGRRVIAATGKQGDGIVSRYLNRPISRAITGQLLRLPGVRPGHASVATAVVGVAMALALLFGGGTGLIVGAVLFQAASILDGVDGEIARAAHRTSDQGAMLDSVIDAGTNLAFIAGVAVNVGRAGDLTGAAAGAAALAMLASGLLLIGRRAQANGEPVNFDVIKVHFRKRGRPSAVMEALILLTMRDFFAAACAAAILFGLAHQALLAFAIITAGWLAVTVCVLAIGARLHRNTAARRAHAEHASA